MTNKGNKNFYDEFYFKKVIEKYKNIMSKNLISFMIG